MVFLNQLLPAFRASKLQLSGSLAPLADPADFQRYLRPLHQTEWAVYCKPPFSGPAQVLAYLARYTHRVAISNHRILAIDNGRVCVHWRDYRHHDKREPMTLATEEFIRNSESRIIPSSIV